MSFFGGASGGKKKKDKYKQLTLAIKQTVLERAKYRCQDCSVKLSGTNEPQFIHINGSKKDNRPENLKALCPKCIDDSNPGKGSSSSSNGSKNGTENQTNMFSSLKKIFSKG